MTRQGWYFSIAICVACVSAAPAQPGQPPPKSPAVYWTASPGEATIASADAFMVPGDQDDPAYKTYKDGYNLVLDEEWTGAREKFAELLSKYPKSDYIDDAQYWTAYVLKHVDYTKAIDAYKQFIKQYPKSKYYDDAVADLSDLDANIVISAPGASAGVVAITGKGKGYAYALGPDMRKVRLDMRKLRNEMRMTQPGTPMPALAPLSPRAMTMFSNDDDLDPETRVKMEALYAIGDTKDDKSFQTLKEVALDRKQAWPLREAAIGTLSDFKKYDVLPILLELARKDTNEEVQNAAIARIGELGKDKNKTVETLGELFNAVPKHRTSQLETILYSVADVGNDKAVEFLSHVARTHEDYDLRSSSVSLLGQIGGEKARAALYEVLRSK